MDIEEIRAKVKEIERLALRDQGESAHVAQDALYRDVLEAVASGELLGAAAVVAASLALKVEEIEFDRWCA